MSAYAIAVFIFILAYSFYMGVNDGSNAIATTVVTRAVQPRTAILIAALINFVVPIAVFLLGMLSVADNISYKLIANSEFVDISEKQAFSFVFSGLLGAIIWGGITFCLRIPNSTSHTLLGGIIGAGIAALRLRCRSGAARGLAGMMELEEGTLPLADLPSGGFPSVSCCGWRWQR